MPDQDPKITAFNAARAQGLSVEAAIQSAGITDDDFGLYSINNVGTPATNPNYGRLEPAGFGHVRPNEVIVSSNGRPVENVGQVDNVDNPPVNTVSEETVTTTTTTVTTGSTKTTIIQPTQYQDTAQSRELQAQADSLAAQKAARVNELKSQGASGAQILRDSEFRSLSNQQAEAAYAAQQAKTPVPGSGQITVTETPGSTSTTVVETSTPEYVTKNAALADPGPQTQQINQAPVVSRPVDAASTVEDYANFADQEDREFGRTLAPLEEAPAVTPTVTPVVTEGSDFLKTPEPQKSILPGGDPSVDAQENEPPPPEFHKTVVTSDPSVDAQENEPPQPVFHNTVVTSDPSVDAQENEAFNEPDEAPEEGARFPQTVEDYADIQDREEGERLDAIANDNPTDRRLANSTQGIPGATNDTRAQASLQDTANFQKKQDWRVRLSLSPGSTYLYNDTTNVLLAPLKATDGIIFPYTPQINITYGANYNTVTPTHSNYKLFQYENSFVDTINITCDFTAQDTDDATYLLAVIHFLRSVTKMFYGQDQNPKPGTPPPLCYLFGLGEFQFSAHPLAITNFTYNLPADVDYICAGGTLASVLGTTSPPGVNRGGAASITKPTSFNPFDTALNALKQGFVSGLGGTAKGLLGSLIPGGGIAQPNFTNKGFNSTVPTGTVEPTYVPTKIQIAISAIPVVSRYEVSNNFSLQDYANGKLINGVKRAGGGFW